MLPFIAGLVGLAALCAGCGREAREARLEQLSEKVYEKLEPRLRALVNLEVKRALAARATLIRTQPPGTPETPVMPSGTCSTVSSAASPSSSAAKPTTAPSPHPGAVSDSGTAGNTTAPAADVLIVGDETIPLEAVRKAFEFEEMLRSGKKREKDAERERRFRRFAETFVEQRLLAERARREGMADRTPWKELAEAEAGRLLEAYLRRNHLRREGPIDESTLKAWYENNKAMFYVPSYVRARVIETKTKQEALNVLKELQAGADFAQAARKYSIHPSASSGGSVGRIYAGEIPEAEFSRLLSAAEGTPVGPLEHRGGKGAVWRIYKVEAARHGYYKPFESVKSLIGARLRKERSVGVQRRIDGLLEAAGKRVVHKGSGADDEVVVSRDGVCVRRSTVLAYVKVMVSGGRKNSRLDPRAELRFAERLEKWTTLWRLMSDERLPLHLEPSVLDYIHDKALASVYLNEHTRRIRIPREEIERYYEEHLEEFKSPVPVVETSHILLTWGPKGRFPDEKEAREQAERLIRRLQEGADFGELARKWSSDNSASRGGKLPPFPVNRLVKPYADACLSLAPGGITTEPVKTRFGYHVIRLEKRCDHYPLELVRGAIRSTLFRLKARELTASLLAGTRGRTRVTFPWESESSSGATTCSSTPSAPSARHRNE